MKIRYRAPRWRGAVRGSLLAFLLVIVGILLGLPAPRADVTTQVAYTRLPSETVRPQVVNVRDLIRAGRGFDRPARAGLVPIPNERLPEAAGPRALFGNAAPQVSAFSP